MLIHVTQSHIDRGCRGDGQACLVALAISEALGYDVLVESHYITAIDNNLLVWQTPEVVKIFIDDFDVGADVEPFEFGTGRGRSWITNVRRE